jgi:2'-5' RNA ligase
MKRTFIAIEIAVGDVLKSFIAKAQDQFRHSRIKWVEPGYMHLTLAFLGDTDAHQISKVCEILHGLSSDTPVIRFSLRGFGYFGGIRNPKVIWIGTEENEAIKLFKIRLDEKLGIIGFIPEGRPYEPHLTLGRIKEFIDNEQLIELTRLYRGYQFQETEVNEIIYFESQLTISGPIYKPIQQFPLQG